MKKERNSNIELLRIISMLLIILYHIIRRYADYEGNFQTLNTSTYLTETILGIWGLFGVYLFVAISAWFLCSSKFRIKHIISILFGRLPIYVSLYGYVLLPWEIDNLFPQNRQIVKIGCIGAYLIFYYYQMHLTYGLF